MREEKKLAWEASQLAKLDVHPYEAEIETCEFLIYFCAKNRSDLKVAAESTEQTKETSDARSKAIEEKVKQGKL